MRCVLVGACGSGGQTRAAGKSDPVPIDSLFDEVVSADCALLVRCHLLSDQTLCTPFFAPGGTDFNSLGAAVASAKAGNTQYDPVAARGCLNALSTAACSDFYAPSGDTASACQSLFTGTRADGSRCIADAECQAGSFCASPPNNAGCDGTCTHGGTQCNTDAHCTNGQVCDMNEATQTSLGTCVTPTPPGAQNQPCGTNNVCQAGFVCSFTEASGVCQPRGQSGQPCTPGAVLGNCADGLVCVVSDDGSSRTCMPFAGKGATCQVQRQCGGLDRLLICDETTHRCVDAPSSGPCAGTSLTCNQASTYCDQSANTPTCRPYLAIGAACSVNTLECGLPGVATCQATDPAAPTGTCRLVTQASCVP